MPPASAPQANTPGAACARSSTASPPRVVVTPATRLDRHRAGAALARARPLPRPPSTISPTLRSRTRSPSAVVATRNQARARGWRAIHCAVSTSDQVRARAARRARWSPRRAARSSCDRRDEVRSGPRARAARASRERRPRPGRRSCAPPAARPDPQAVPGRAGRRAQQHVLGLGRHVLAQQLAARARSRPWRGSAARPSGGSRSGLAEAHARRRPRAARAVRPAGSKRTPVVSALPVLALDHGRAERLEPAQVFVEALEQRAAGGARRRRGTRARKRVEARGGARRRRSTAASSRPARSSFSSTVGCGAQAARLGRRHEAGHARAGDHQVGHDRLRPGRSPACAPRTRCGCRPGPRRKTASVLGASLSRRSRCRAAPRPAAPRRPTPPAARCG